MEQKLLTYKSTMKAVLSITTLFHGAVMFYVITEKIFKVVNKNIITLYDNSYRLKPQNINSKIMVTLLTK